MTNNLPELLDDYSDGCLDLLLLWLDGSHEGLLENDLQPLTTWLISVEDETALDQCLSRSLVSYLDCLAELSQWLLNDQNPKHGTIQQEWIGSINRVTQCIPRGGADWYQAASTLCQRQDTFLSATLGHVLETLPEHFRLPAEVHQLVTFVRLKMQKKYERWPVPPAAGRSVLISDYVHRSSDKTFHVLLEKLMPILVDWDDEALEEFARHSVAENVANIEFDVDAVLIAIDSLADVVRDFLNGWPVERGRLQRPLASLKCFIADHSENSIVTFVIAGNLLRQTTDTLKIDTIDSCETEAQPSDAPNPSMSYECSDVAGRLMELADDIQSQNACLTSRFSSSLAGLIRLTNSEHEKRTNGILDLLVELNEELCGTSKDETDVLNLRNRLHDILVENLKFRVLGDDDLVGKPFDAVRDWVTIHGSYDSPSLPSDHIISVRRPGYLFRSSNGATNLVRPAEVNVSR